VYAGEITVDTRPLYTYADKETNYTIGPFDRILMKIWRYEDLSGELLVKEDGTIFIPNVGFIDVNGLTLREAHTKLTQGISVYVKNPQIDLMPVEVRSKRYYIMGAVRQPGGYPIFKPITLREAVSLSGGSVEQSLLSNAYLNRRGKVYPVDIHQAFTGQSRDIYLTQGDMLYIPSRADATVYVLGEVRNPGAYPVSSGGLDVMQAVAQAGGYTVSASEDEIGIVRRKGDKFELQVANLEDAVKYAEGNPYAFRLQPGDIVWVPPMGIASWNRGLALITPTLDTFLFKPLQGARDYFLIEDLIRRR
jgi:polysaccharide export outer membrane protein